MPKLKFGSLGAVVIALAAAAASLWLGFGSDGIFCDRLPSMTIMAVLAAFVIALCFRLLGRAVTSGQKWQIAAALLIAAVTLFANTRFVLKYHGLCEQLQQQMRQMTTPSH
ncbi:MAG TPA: hypothetical protein VHT24_06225 [Pseudacidobacterium sp.]|jgi:hypothetical protein|nr:hypothetical protein [Pseudacidobacterium sp.]